MIIEGIITYIGPKVVEYLFSHLREWAEPVAKGVGCKALNFAGEKYAEQRHEIEAWVRNLIPGQKWDDFAVKVVDQMVVFGMQEIAEFIECEVKMHGLNAVDVLERSIEAGKVPAIFNKISAKVTYNTKEFRQAF
jgi:hypothetical protein